MKVRERLLSDAPEELDRFGIAGSNTVVLELGSRFETVERPLEATLYEALYRLRSRSNGVIGVLRGEGEGDVSSDAELGFSGLAAALATEGYQVRIAWSRPRSPRFPPTSTPCCCWVPRRALLPESVAALERYLERGGRLVALLEPGAQSGIEALLDALGHPGAGRGDRRPGLGSLERRGARHRPDRLQLRVASAHARPEPRPHDVLRRRAAARAAQRGLRRQRAARGAREPALLGDAGSLGALRRGGALAARRRARRTTTRSPRRDAIRARAAKRASS